MNWEEIKKKGNPVYKTGIEPVDLFKGGDILWDWCIGEIIAKAYRNREDTAWNVDPVDEVYKVAQPGEVLKDLDEIIHHVEMLKCCAEEGVKNDRRYINLNIQANAATEEIRQQLQRVSTKGHRLGTKSNRRRA